MREAERSLTRIGWMNAHVSLADAHIAQGRCSRLRACACVAVDVAPPQQRAAPGAHTQTHTHTRASRSPSVARPLLERLISGDHIVTIGPEEAEPETQQARAWRTRVSDGKAKPATAATVACKTATGRQPSAVARAAGWLRACACGRVRVCVRVREQVRA